MIHAKLLRRGVDSHGSGAFGAPRGSRKHNGIDFAASVGQEILTPVTGIVSKVGYPYGDDLSFRYVEVTTPKNHKHRVFYISPSVQVGDSVLEGVTCLGLVQDLCKRYPKITNHIHYEIKDGNKYLNPDDYNAS